MIMFKFGEKTFGELAQEQLVSYGEQWKDVALTDGKDTIYNPEKPRLPLQKQRQNCKQRV